MDLRRLLEAEEEIAFRVEASGRLDVAIAGRAPWTSRAAARAWILEGLARVDGAPALRPGKTLRAGQRVAVRVRKTPRDLAASIDDLLAIPLVHRGPDFVVVDKPHGLACHPAGGVIRRTLLVALGERLRGEYEHGGPWLPHRLDRETGGLCVVALGRAALRRFSRGFASGSIRRFYSARVRGRLEPTPGWIDVRLPLRAVGERPRRFQVSEDGVPAHTRLRVLAHGSQVRLEAVTGRQHQLRVHLAHLGHPIEGDPLYDPASTAGEALRLLADELQVPGAVALEECDRIIRR